MLNFGQPRYHGSPPAVAERQRALSICFGNSFQNEELSKQSGFHLLKLPLEVREMIYAELLPWERVWILLVDKKLVCDWEAVKVPNSVPVTSLVGQEHSSPRPNGAESSQTPTLVSPRTRPMREGQHNRTRRKNPGVFSKFNKWGLSILPFMRTCRRVYSDIMPYLYSRPTFAFHDAVPFLAFVASIPPSHFQCIRSVELGFAYPYALPALPRYLEARINRAREPIKTIPRPDVCKLDYWFFYDGTFSSPLHNASVLPSNTTDGCSSYMWDAIANALVEMKGLKRAHITLLNIPRSITMLTEKDDVESRQRDAQDIMDSLRWVGRPRPWKGETTESDKGRETEVIFENVWWKTDRETRFRGHWVREVYEEGKVDWREVGEAAGSAIELYE